MSKAAPSSTTLSPTPRPLNILIVGAGIAGPALAALLQRSNTKHNINIIERAPQLRLTGQQIDIKTEGLPIVKKLGILDAIKAHSVAEAGMELVDGKGRRLMVMMHEDRDKGGRFAKGVASEVEIMRGDLVNILWQLCTQGKQEGITIEFGKTIIGLEQTSDDVTVTFSDHESRRYDLVVGADGQNSKIRRLAFGQETNDTAYHSLGMYAAYYSIPRIQGEGDIGRSYIAHGRRGLMTRTGDRPQTQVFFFSGSNLEELQEVNKADVDKKKAIWADTMRGSGWQTDRFLRDLPNTSDFYDCELAQVKLEHLYRGRVVLLGDAGYCPSVMTGMGTTSALVGAYVLAGELTRNCNDLDSALKVYDDTMRHPIQEWQHISIGKPSMWPSSKFAAWLLHQVIWIVCILKIDRLVQSLMPNGDGSSSKWALPDYAGLD